MKVNHIIVGAKDVGASVVFYCELFEFVKTEDNPGADGGQVLKGKGCDLLILPIDEARLPNPIHFAFEAESLDEFETLLRKTEQMNLAPRSTPARNSRPGPTEFTRSGMTYRNFYFFDPSGVNLEVMVHLN